MSMTINERKVNTSPGYKMASKAHNPAVETLSVTMSKTAPYFELCFMYLAENETKQKIEIEKTENEIIQMPHAS
jgi:hypothetical protein